MVTLNRKKRVVRLRGNWFALALLVPMLALGCSTGEQRSGPEPRSPAQPRASARVEILSEEQVKQRELAMSAKDQLFEKLLGALTASMQANGPASSIEVCKSQAPKLAAEVSSETKVKIGRTSFQLRNAENGPPFWAESFVNERIAEEVNVALEGEALGVLLPIRLKATCLMCHGAKEALQPEVIKAIENAYPDDQATGFAEGDVRGYFWIEVPGGMVD